MRSLVAPLVPTILRHLEGYAEVAGEDARDAAKVLARKLAAVLVGAACAFVALLMLCAWILVLAWETDWRSWTAAGLALLFAVAAAALVWPVLRPGEEKRTEFFPRIRSELVRDRALIERAFDGRTHAPEDGGSHGASAH